ncbi:YecA family protein, partial [Streptomyces griseoincarnatus]
AFDEGEVWAELNDNELVVSNSAGDLLPSTPLNFTPDWYETAARGELMLMVGRNLQGMVQQDSTYLRRAIRADNVVGGVLSLNVVRPRRNGPCPCEMRQGSKYKHCCEKRTTATSGVESRAVQHDGTRRVREDSAFTAG